jgi:hypothetical protein
MKVSNFIWVQLERSAETLDTRNKLLYIGAWKIVGKRVKILLMTFSFYFIFFPVSTSVFSLYLPPPPPHHLALLRWLDGGLSEVHCFPLVGGEWKLLLIYHPGFSICGEISQLTFL